MLYQHVVGLAEVGLDAEEVDEVVVWAPIVTLEMRMPLAAVVVEVKMVILIGFRRGNVRRVSHSAVAAVADMGAEVAMGMKNLEATLHGPHGGCTSGGVALAVVMR